MNCEWIDVDVRGSAMPVLACSPGASAAPAVILCMHAPGVDSFMEEIARRLADAGYAAYAPDFYHAQGETGEDPLKRMGRLRDAELQADLAETLSLVHSRGHGRTAVVGFCMGGRIALIAASALTALDAVVSFYGGFIRESWGEGETPLARASSIACPACLIGGALDSNPSPNDIADLSRTLGEQGNTPEVEIYEDVGHAFLNFNRPGYREEIAMRAWRQCERFLERHLQVSPT